MDTVLSLFITADTMMVADYKYRQFVQNDYWQGNDKLGDGIIRKGQYQGDNKAAYNDMATVF